jgi:hypothetical protein
MNAGLKCLARLVLELAHELACYRGELGLAR